MFQHVVIYSFVFFPCLTYAASSPERSVVVISVEKNPEFIQACVPCFKYIGISASKPDMIAQNKETVLDGSFGSGSPAIPINNKSYQDSDQRTNEARKQLRYGNHLSIILLCVLLIIIFVLFKKILRLKELNEGMENIVLHPPPHFNVRWDDKKAKWISLS